MQACSEQLEVDLTRIAVALIHRIVQQSEGNPGAIKRMIQMAKLPKYLTGGQIKSVPLCIDFKVAAIGE